MTSADALRAEPTMKQALPVTRPAVEAGVPRAGRGRTALAGPAALVGVAVAFFALLVWSGQAPAQTQPKSAATTAAGAQLATLTAGQTLYELHCQSCHGAGGVGGKAPTLVNVGSAAVDFFLSTGRMPLSSLTAEPQAHKPYFTNAQIAEVAAYVNSLGVVHGTPGPARPTVVKPCNTETATCPTLSEGNQLFMLNCAQCHDASGAGGLLSHGYVVPSLRQATLAQIAEAIRVGPRPMPNFGPGELSNQQVSAIADYVSYISHTRGQGGLGIANFGPVPEGFVGIIFGLGALLVAARLIGNRG